MQESQQLRLRPVARLGAVAPVAQRRPVGPILLRQTVLHAHDGIGLHPLAQSPDHGFARKPLLAQVIGALLVEVSGGDVQSERHVAVIGVDKIIAPAESKGRADLRSFVSDAGYMECHLVLAVQNPHALIQASRQENVPIHFQDLKRKGLFDSTLVMMHIADAQRLCEERFDALYSSDLGRAYRTAVSIAEETGHAVIVDTRLRERNFGVFEGLTNADIKARYPEIFATCRESFGCFIHDSDPRKALEPESAGAVAEAVAAAGASPLAAAMRPGLPARQRACSTGPSSGPRSSKRSSARLV